MANQSITKQIENSWMAIEGVLSNPQLIKALEPYGYTRKELLKGKALCEDASLIQNSRRVKYSQQRNTTDQLNLARKQAHEVYMQHVQLARMVVPADRERYPLLQLEGRRERTLTKWLHQVRAFYQNVGLIATELEKRGVTSEELAQAAAMVEAVAAARVQQNAHKSNVQQSKQERDAALEALHVWMADFLRAARFAFAKKPQQLEALGIVV